MRLLATLLSLAALAFQPVFAQPVSDPVPLPTDQRIVVFTYDPNAIYTILTQPGSVTHIELADGEGLVMQPKLGDTIQWRVDGGPRQIFVKPVRHDLATTMTLVTNLRTYQFDLRASASGGKRYQKVSFEYPEVETKLRLEQEKAQVVVHKEQERLSSINLSEPQDPTKQNFNYVMEGDAQWRPAAVFDDGKFTYFRMGTKAQDLPAFFLLEKDNKAILVNYTIRGDFVVVQRTADRFLLRLGTQDVKVSVKGKEGGSGGLAAWFKFSGNGSSNP